MYIEYIYIDPYTFGGYIRLVPTWKWFVDPNNRAQYQLKNKRWI